MPKKGKGFMAIFGKRDGVTIEYFENGRISNKWNYKNGILIK